MRRQRVIGIFLAITLSAVFAIALSAVYQGRAAAGACDVSSETGQGFVNYLIALGIISRPSPFSSWFSASCFWAQLFAEAAGKSSPLKINPTTLGRHYNAGHQTRYTCQRQRQITKLSQANHPTDSRVSLFPLAAVSATRNQQLLELVMPILAKTTWSPAICLYAKETLDDSPEGKSTRKLEEAD